MKEYIILLLKVRVTEEKESILAKRFLSVRLLAYFAGTICNLCIFYVYTLVTGSSCRRTKSQTGAERSAWRDTSESDRGKETPRYLMNIQKSDSPTDLKVFTEWDMQECNDFSVKISYGWVAALKENIALLQVIVRLLWLLWFEVLKISIAWAALLTPHLCMFSPQALQQHCLWRQSQVWGVVALLQNMPLVIVRSLWSSWFEEWHGGLCANGNETKSVFFGITVSYLGFSIALSAL